MNTYIAQLLYGYTLLRCILHYCITTPGLRETSVDKKPCLGAYAPARRADSNPGPLIERREHEPLYHSAPIDAITLKIAF